jgi:hypothetical protein
MPLKPFIRNVKTIKYPNFLRPEKRENKNFLQKNFCFLSERTPPAGSSREKKKFFLQKNFFFSLFGFSIGNLYFVNIPNLHPLVISN